MSPASNQALCRLFRFPGSRVRVHSLASIICLIDYPASYLRGTRWHYLLRLAVALFIQGYIETLKVRRIPYGLFCPALLCPGKAKPSSKFASANSCSYLIVRLTHYSVSTETLRPQYPPRLHGGHHSCIPNILEETKL